MTQSYSISYDVPIDDYHRAKYLSTSKLGDFATRGPAYFAGRYVHSNAPSFESTEAQEMGQAFEDLICLERAAFDKLYAIKPEDMTFSTKEGKAWKTEHAGRTILKADDVDALHMMREALFENESARVIVESAKMQATIRGEYPGTPGLQSRPDFLLLDGNLMTGYQPATVDLKTTISFSKLTSGRGVGEYRYHAQAALCAETLRQCDVESRSYLIASEKIRPYRCVVVEVTPEWVSTGWSWCERQLRKLAEHYASDKWPRVEREVIALPPPPRWIADAGDEDDN